MAKPEQSNKPDHFFSVIPTANAQKKLSIRVAGTVPVGRFSKDKFGMDDHGLGCFCC